MVEACLSGQPATQPGSYSTAETSLLVPPERASQFFNHSSELLLSLNHDGERLLGIAEELLQIASRLEELARELRELADSLEENCCSGAGYREFAGELEKSSARARKEAENISKTGRIVKAKAWVLEKERNRAIIAGGGFDFILYRINSELKKAEKELERAESILREMKSQVEEAESLAEQAEEELQNCRCKTLESTGMDTSTWSREDWLSWAKSAGG